MRNGVGVGGEQEFPSVHRNVCPEWSSIICSRVPYTCAPLLIRRNVLRGGVGRSAVEQQSLLCSTECKIYAAESRLCFFAKALLNDFGRA